MHPMFRLAQIIAARLWRPVVLSAAALLLSACSALQLGYNQAHTALYWWIDGYADLDDAQSARLRQDIDRFMLWHRQEELPAYAQRLRQWRALAANDLSGAQVCAQVEALRGASLRLMERSHGPLAQLALTLSPAQQQHLERHQAKSNQGFEEDFLRGTADARMERRLERTLDRYETLYGTLTSAQVEKVRQGLRASPFDPARALAERRTRQAELRALIRQWQTARTPPEAAASTLLGWLQGSLFASPAAGSDAAGWVRHGCQSFADLHNSTSAAQRRHAQAVLQGYEDDLRALVSAH